MKKKLAIENDRNIEDTYNKDLKFFATQERRNISINNSNISVNFKSDSPTKHNNKGQLKH